MIPFFKFFITRKICMRENDCLMGSFINNHIIGVRSFVHTQTFLLGQRWGCAKELWLVWLPRGWSRTLFLVFMFFPLSCWKSYLHWQLDTQFGEDASQIHKGHSPENLAVLRKISKLLLQMEPSFKASIHRKQRKALMVHDYLLSVLATAHLFEWGRPECPRRKTCRRLFFPTALVNRKEAQYNMTERTKTVIF